MEDLNTPLDSGMGVPPPVQPLRFTQPVRSDLLETSRWVLFLSVLLFILMGILSIVSLVMMAAGGYAAIGGLLMLALYTLLFFFPGFYYYKFSTLTRQALNFGDNARLDEGFAYLRRFYRWVGILVIVLIAMYFVLAAIGLGKLASGGNPFGQ